MVPHPKVITADHTITTKELTDYKRFVVTTAGVWITLPVANAFNAKNLEFHIINASTGAIIVGKTGQFLGAEDSVIIGPYETCQFFSATTTYQNTSGYYWMVAGKNTRSEPLSWSPTESWTTGTPDTSAVADYKISNGICNFWYDATWTDGNGATAVTLTLPVTPRDINAKIPVHCIQTVGSTTTNPLAYVDAVSDTAAARLLKVNSLSTCTDATAGRLTLSGWYPIAIDQMAAESPTLTITETPTMASVAFSQVSKGVLRELIYSTTADSNAASTLTISLPVTVVDNNNYIACEGFEVAGAGGATIYAPKYYINGTDNTAENRIVGVHALTTATDGQALNVAVALEAEVYGWASWTPTLTWTATTAPTCTTVARYRIDDEQGLCFFNFYTTTADGNGATALTISGLPVAAKYLESRRIALAGNQLVNTTWSHCCPYINAGSATNDTRKTISFGNLSPATDAATCTIEVSGCYPIG